MTPANVDETAALLDGRYRLGDLVGEGGMARVYRAEDVMLGRTVAIKLIRPGVDGATSERTRSEMTVLASLNHPSLVTLYDARLAPGQPEYLAMEFVEGPTLATRLASGALPPEIVAHLATELAEALHVVHRAGVVHRDIKPSNVLLSPPHIPGGRPRAKLADFGIAYLLDASRLTSPGLVIGTMAYLAPEQLRGDDPVPASDIYSLGLVLIEALTGDRVHPEGAGMAAAVARLDNPPAVPASLGPEWTALLSRMLDVEPGRRPSAAEVAASARTLTERMPPTGAAAGDTAVTVPLTGPTLVAPLAGAGVAAAGAGVGAAGAAGAVGGVSPTAASAGAPASSMPVDRARTRKRLAGILGAGLAAALVALAAVFGISALNGTQQSPEPAVTVPADPDPSEPPTEDPGNDVVVDPGLTEQERKEAEQAQKKAEQEQKKLEEEQRKEAEEEQKRQDEQDDD